MRFCPHCGSQLEANAQFCGSCGTPVAASGNPSASPSASAASAPPYASQAPRSGWPSTGPAGHGSAAPWAISSAHPGAGGPGAGGPGHPGGMGASPVKARSALRRIPKPVYLGVAALLAVGIGATAALSLRESPTMNVDTSLTNQPSEALTKAPTKKWSFTSTQLAQAAGLDTSASSSQVSMLDFGRNGIVLASISDGTKKAVVGIKESSGSVAWRAEGSFDHCDSTKNAAGWVCTYTPNAPDSSSSSSSTSDTQQAKLVTLDSNGRRSDMQNLKEGESLYRAMDGGEWLVKGVGNADGDSSSSSDSSSDSTGNRAVTVQKIGDDGKPGWRYERSLNSSGDPLSAKGAAGAGLFTVDGVTYLRGVETTDGKGIALDSSGKETDKAGSAVLANDRGRRITVNKKGRYQVDGDSMKRDTTQVSSPAVTDSKDVPLFNVVGSELQKLNSDGTGVDWKKTVADATPVAQCGGVTLLEGENSSMRMFNGKGNENWSGSQPGTHQFCWGGQQFTFLEGTKASTRNASDGKEVWSTDLAFDTTENTGDMHLTPSPDTDGFVAADDGTVAYWGK